MAFVSRAGEKLDHAIRTFGVRVDAAICADLGSNTGGFVDCLLQHGAAKVYAIDTGYGALDWKLRNDPRVVVMERTNALHVDLAEKVRIVTIDVAWTKQRLILPAAARILQPDGQIITLIKPHYEAELKQLRGGVLPADLVPQVVEAVKSDILVAGFDIIAITESPLRGGKGNIEMLAHLRLQSKTT